MTKDLISKAEIKETEDYLNGYALNMKLLRLCKYEKDASLRDGEENETFGDELLARAKMFEVRHFIMGLKNSNEKLLLYYRYVRGETVERCAVLLGISRSSAYRLRDRALILAAEQRRKNAAEL
ncbi:MAG: hypothetical protein IJ011_09510 [Clostridia bacterium]|nr:hypothetical protein [Clostridia bacterium]